MRYTDIRTDEDMLEYLLECTLATVEWYAGKKRPPACEVKRQCSIADKILSHISHRKIESGSRRERLLSVGCSAREYYNSIKAS